MLVTGLPLVATRGSYDTQKHSLLFQRGYSESSQLWCAETSDWLWILQVPGVYTDAYSDAALTYASTSYLDDMAYAAAWMYYATKVSALRSP